MNARRIVFLHCVNMTWYRGHEENIHAGSFDFARRHGFGFEMYNFLDVGRRHYGYVELRDKQAIRLENLGASKSASSLNGVLVVWTAPCRDGKGREVVGWYGNATLHRHYIQPRGKVKRVRRFTHPETKKAYEMGYRVEADIGDARLLHPEERLEFRIGPYPKGTKGVPGRSSIYYPSKQTSDEAEELRMRVLAFIKKSEAGPRRSKRGKSPAWKGQSQERKKKIEIAAVKYVCKHFGTGRNGRGYKIESKEEDNLGYDLLMTKDNVTLCVEVKGRSINDVVAEFSPNESRVIKEHQHGRFGDGDYRVCIVTDALNEHGQRRLHHYSWWTERKAWIDVEGSRTLSFRPSGATIAKMNES